MRFLWIIALAAAACAAQPVPEPSVAGRHFVAQMPEIAEARQRPRLEFASDGRLAGYTGCNSVAGKWRVDGGVVRLEALAVTRRACMGPGGEVEKRFLAAVSAASKVTFEGGKLVVQGASGERLVFAEGS